MKHRYASQTLCRSLRLVEAPRTPRWSWLPTAADRACVAGTVALQASPEQRPHPRRRAL